MRSVKKTAGILKVIGIVLLCISLVVSLYGLATSGKLWGEMSSKLNAYNVKTGAIDRFNYDSTLYRAMNYLYANGVSQQQHVVTMFSSWAERANQNESAVQEALIIDSIAAFDADFDQNAFLNRMSNSEKLREQRAETSLFEYLDSLNVVAGPKGKMLPNKDAAAASTYIAALYESFVADHGAETAGSYLEFLQAIQAMCETARDNGATWNNSQAWLSENLTADAYQTALTAVRNTVSNEDASVLECYQQSLNAGKTTAEFVDKAYALLLAKNPQVSELPKSAFATALFTKLNSAAYDGDWAKLAAETNTAAESAKASSFDGFLIEHAANIAATAEQRIGIAGINVLWFLVSIVWWMYLAGILLILISLLMIKLMENTLMKRIQSMEVPQEDDQLLRVEHLSQFFRNGDAIQKAVNDVSFTIKKGEVFGLVGESGCGKTTTGRTIINLYDPTTGDVYFHGLRISSTLNGMPLYRKQRRRERDNRIHELQEQIKLSPEKAEELRRQIAEERRLCREDIDKAEIHALESDVEKKRCTQLYRQQRQAELTREYKKDLEDPNCNKEERTRRYNTEMKVAARDNVMARMQMIFQDPIASINPRMTVREIIAEGLVIQGVTDKKYIDDKVNEMLELVGLVREHADRYPHEFSGGQRQRIGIARAIVMRPDLIIADEPISALDVSIQAQVINLMNELRNNMGLTLMFIAHNLSVVKYFSDRIAVMYFGRIVEMTTSDELFAHPLHPYTKSLLSAIPYPDPYYEKQRKRIEYHPDKVHDYSVDKPSLHEIVPGHFIYCNETELAAYKEELQK